MYGSPTVDSVVEGGGFANSGVGGTGFNSPMGGRNSPRVYSTARSASVGSGINLPAHGGTGGAALVPGSSSGFGVGRSMLGVTSSTGFGSGPSVGRGNVQINGFSPGIATTVPGNSLTSGPGNGFATGPGNVNLGGPWLPINRSFNLGQTSTSFGVGEVSNAPSNGASIGSPRGDGVHSNGVAASELHQQLWEILNDPDVEVSQSSRTWKSFLSDLMRAHEHCTRDLSCCTTRGWHWHREREPKCSLCRNIASKSGSQSTAPERSRMVRSTIFFLRAFGDD